MTLAGRGLTPEEHAYSILADPAIPKHARLAAARSLLVLGSESDRLRAEQIFASARVETDDELWAALLELLAVVHPEPFAVWEYCRVTLDRLVQIPARRATGILNRLIAGGVSAGDITAALMPSRAEDQCPPALVWLSTTHEIHAEITGSACAQLKRSVAELNRSTLMLHLIALCDPSVRAALGRSSAYTQYKSLYWALQDWPYSDSTGLAHHLQQGALAPEEAEVIAEYGAELRMLLQTWTGDNSPLANREFHEELDHIGKTTMTRLRVDQDPAMLFCCPRAPGADQ